MVKSRWIGWTAVVLLGAPVTVAAESPGRPLAEPPGTAAEELHEIGAQLERIVALLERQVTAQELDLAMKRVEHATAMETEARRALEAARSRRTSVENELFGLEQRLRWMAEEIESGESGMTPAQIETMTNDADRLRERLDEQAREIDREILELEDALAARSRESREWRDFVDRQLVVAGDEQ